MNHKEGSNELRSAFILNMGPNGLGIARSLGRRGVPVVGVDHRWHIPGMRSKYVRPLVSEDLQSYPEQVLELLLKEGEELGDKGVLFPASDAAVLFMSRHRNELAPNFDFRIPPKELEDKMVNKRGQQEEARRLGIPLAEVFYPRSKEDLDEVVSGVRFPAFIKPLYSHIWYLTFGNKGFIVRGPDELYEKMEKVFEAGLDVMVQSIIMPPGMDLYSVGAYFGPDGYVSPHFVWHKLRQFPPNFGVGSLVESVHQPEVVELAMRYMKGIGYQGIGYVEFKRDQRDGEWKLIELNARTGQTNALSDAAGIPLVLFEYNDLTGIPQPMVGDYQDGVRWWDSLNDLDSFGRLWREGQLTFLDWIRSWNGADVNAYYASDDIMPFLRRYRYGVDLAKLICQMVKNSEEEAPLLISQSEVRKGSSIGERIREVRRAL